MDLPKMQHSKFLFVDRQTSVAMRFFMRPSAEKGKLKPYIEHGGGILNTKGTPNDIRLVEPGSKVLTSDVNTVSTKFIWDCVKKNQLLDKSDYRVRIRDLDVSDISDEDDTRNFVVKRMARKLRSRVNYTREDDEKIIEYITKTKRYDEVKGVLLWRALEGTGELPGHTWESLRERWRKQIVRKLHTFKLTENQRCNFGLNVGSKKRRKTIGRKKHARRSNTKHEVEQLFVDSCSDSEPRNVLSAPLAGGSENEPEKKQEMFPEREVCAIFRYIFRHFLDDDVMEDSMWMRMEKHGITSHSWSSMKEHFLDRVLPNIHSYDLQKQEIEKLSTIVMIPKKVGSGHGSSPDEGIKRSTTSSEICILPVTDKESIDARETSAIFRYVFDHFVKEDITSDALWMKMEKQKVTPHDWRSMKDHFYQHMVPNIHSYRIAKLHLNRLATVISLPDAPQENSLPVSSGSRQETSAAEKRDQDCVRYTEEHVEAMLKNIFDRLGQYEPTGDSLWKDMERSSVTPFTWKSMKFHFFHHVVPSIHEYKLSETSLSRLRSCIRLPDSPGSKNLIFTSGSAKNKAVEENSEGRSPQSKSSTNKTTQSSPKKDNRSRKTETLPSDIVVESPQKTRDQNVKKMSPSKIAAYSLRKTRSPETEKLPSEINIKSPQKTRNQNLREKSPNKNTTAETLPKFKGRSLVFPSDRWEQKSQNLNACEKSSNDTTYSIPRTRSHVAAKRLPREVFKESPHKTTNQGLREKSPNKNSAEDSLASSQSDVEIELMSDEGNSEISQSKFAGEKSPMSQSKTTATSSPKSQTQSAKVLSESQSKNAENSPPESNSLIPFRGEDRNNCTVTELYSPSSSAMFRFNTWRTSLGAKLGCSTSPSTRSSSSAVSSVDTLDEQLLGNLRAPILQSMQRKMQSVLTPLADEPSRSGSIQEVDAKSIQNQTDSSDGFKVPEATAPRKKRNASADICPTPAKSSGPVNRKNHIPPPSKPSARNVFFPPIRPVGRNPAPVALRSGLRSHCISTNSIILMENAKQDIDDLIEEVGEWFVSSVNSPDGVRISPQKMSAYYRKLEHLNEFMYRALLSARVERIMDKSSNYMSFEDKLAIYKFYTFYKSLK